MFQCRIHLRWRVVDVMAFQFAVSCGHSYMEMVSHASAVQQIGSFSREEILEYVAHDLAESVLADIAEGCDKRGLELHINLFSSAFPLFQTSPLETESDYHAE